MLPEVINGLPLHILLVHVVVIVLPAASLLTLLGALWPAFRRKLGVLTPIVALIGLVSVPLATNAGEWLLQRVNPTPLISAHVALGDTLLPWAVGQFVLATAIWVWYRWFAAARVTPPVPERRANVPVPAGAPLGAGSAAGLDAGESASAGAGARGAEAQLHGDDPFAPAGSTSRATTNAATTATAGRAHLAAPGRARAGRTVSVVVSIIAIVAALGVGSGTVVKVVQIGESGATAVWSGSFSSDPVAG